MESLRPDRLFEDPLAAWFVAAEPDTEPRPTTPDPRRIALGRRLVIRTRFFDELLLSAAQTCPQVVILGAGLDARAFRLAWPRGTRVFELDQPDMLSWKQQLLDSSGVEPRCQRITVPTDLRTDWSAALGGAGHDPEVPTSWLAEGLLVYLPGPVVEQLLRDLTARSPAGSRLGLTVRLEANAAPTTALGQLWISTAPEDAPRWLRDHGWAPTFHRYGDLGSSYGRSEWADLKGSGLVEAERLTP